MSYSEDALHCNNWTIIWYFHVLSVISYFLHCICFSFVCQHWLEASEWQETCFLNMHFLSVCIYRRCSQIHVYLLIFNDFGFEKERNGKNFKKEKLAYRTKGKFNEIWIIYIQIYFMNSPWHLKSLSWFSLPCFFPKSPSSVVIWYALWECKLFL